MNEAPYAKGDRVTVVTADGPTDVVVSVVVGTTSVDPGRRWRVLCRSLDGPPIATPLYCGDDGSGTRIRPPASVPATASPGGGG